MPTKAGSESHEAECAAAGLSGVVIRSQGCDAGDDEGQTKTVEGAPDHGLHRASCCFSNLMPEEGGTCGTALSLTRCSLASLKAKAPQFWALQP